MEYTSSHSVEASRCLKHTGKLLKLAFRPKPNKM